MSKNKQRSHALFDSDAMQSQVSERCTRSACKVAFINYIMLQEGNGV